MSCVKCFLQAVKHSLDSEAKPAGKPAASKPAAQGKPAGKPTGKPAAAAAVEDDFSTQFRAEMEKEMARLMTELEASEKLEEGESASQGSLCGISGRLRASLECLRASRECFSNIRSSVVDLVICRFFQLLHQIATGKCVAQLNETRFDGCFSDISSSSSSFLF